MNTDLLSFGAYCLDRASVQLLKDGEAVPLPPKALAALIYLVESRGRLIAKDELLDAVWGHRFVSQGVLKNTITTLRQALNDDPKAPHYIETVHRLGYRFIAEEESGNIQTSARAVTAPFSSRATPSNLVGRAAPLAELDRLLASAALGKPQMAFVTGEPGIGKTALIETFLQAAGHPTLIGRGQCIEQFGQGEPYLPVLEALNDLVKHDQARLSSLLRRVAPTWLAQLPWYLNEADQTLMQQVLAGATQLRMLREFGEFLDRCSTDHPVILVLEDLHWSDHATQNLLAYLARRKQPACWLILGSYRPEDVMLTGHDLKHVLRELQIQGQCSELQLEPLSEAAIGEYLSQRFADRELAANWARALHRRTEGLPFFLVQLVETVILDHDPDRDALSDLALPEGVQQLLERQFERLPDDFRRMLEAASVVGMNFSAKIVAAVLVTNGAEAEEGCETLARLRHFIQPAAGESGRYGFRHAFYHRYAYDQLPPLLRAGLHLRIGEWLESSRLRPEELATELALHFERGRDLEKAVKYLQLAANNAVARHALHEAAELLRRGLAHLEQQLPETPDHIRMAAEMYAALVTALQATQGYGASELERIQARALELARQAGNADRLFGLLWGIAIFNLVQTNYEYALLYAEKLLTEADGIADVSGQIGGHFVLGVAKMYSGDLNASLEHLSTAQSLYRAHGHEGLLRIFGHDPGASVETNFAMLRWLMGYPETAVNLAESALRRAEALGHPYTLVIALMYNNWLAQYLRESEKVLNLDFELDRLVRVHGFAMLQDYASVRTGWTLAILGQTQAGIIRINQAMADLNSADAHILKAYHLALLADAQAQDGRPGEGLVTLAKAFKSTGQGGERIFEAELYRLRGKLLLEAGYCQQEAESSLHKALAIAREHGAKSWELRTATSLARLWRSQGRLVDAKNLLNEIYGWFTEGFDTPDLRDAKALLDTLERSVGSAGHFVRL